AWVCHEANRAFQRVTEDPVISPPWEDASQEQKNSILEGVRQVLGGASAPEMHQSWCEHKTARGWRYGPVKDEEAHTHPCLVPYPQLPASQRAKDHLIRAIVHTLT